MKFLMFLVLSMFTVAKADPPATHGMLLFGKNKMYASHLPMYHHPHDYQVVLEISASEITRVAVLKKYENAKANWDGIFTLVPEKMDLSKLIDGTKKSFSAAIYKGHFEQGGEDLGLVQINVAKVIFSKKLNASEPKEKTEYVVFGKHDLDTGESEYYGVHIVKGMPEFDAVVEVAQPFNHHCPSRLCGPDSFFLKGVFTIAKSGPSPTGPLPTEGQVLHGDLFDVKSSILKLIYVNTDELAH